jgi:hypothetical protein
MAVQRFNYSKQTAGYRGIREFLHNKITNPAWTGYGSDESKKPTGPAVQYVQTSQSLKALRLRKCYQSRCSSLKIIGELKTIKEIGSYFKV